MAEMAHQAFPELGIRLLVRFALCVASTIMYVAFLVGLSVWWAYPIPFMIVGGAVPCCGAFLVSFACLVGIRNLRALSGLQIRLVAFAGFILLLGAVVVAYPVYNAVFVALGGSPWRQNAFLLVLPVLKIVLRNMAANLCTSWDALPETTILTVEVFNSL